MKTIGKYEIRGLLGRGGMGAVYKVRLPMIGKILALKLLDPQPALVTLLGYEEIRRRFISEAQTMGRLRHPNVAAIYDFDFHDEKPFFVMEYYCRNLGALIGEGYDLEAPSRVLPVERALDYTLQTLCGLHRLHRSGIVHRDIKPFNLLLGEEGTVKITDFGLSRLRGEPGLDHGRLRVGSPYYTAPEQERDPGSATLRADLYSAGKMFMRFLTGFLVDRQYQPASELNPELGPAWDDFFQTALHIDPGRRFHDAAQMTEALEELALAWREKRESACSGVFWEKQAPDPVKPKYLRDFHRKIPPSLSAKEFGLDDLGRPLAYAEPHLEAMENGTVKDGAAGLVWQADGSEFPLNLAEAGDYITQLNGARFGGFGDWRLPTVPELMSILESPDRSDAPCMDSVFGSEKKCLWSTDRRSAIAAWCVNTDLGYVFHGDDTCYFFVKAVRRG